nr:hypothetical protein [Zea mays]
MAGIQKILFFLFLVFFSAFSWHRSYARESDAAHSAAKGGGFLLPQNDSSTITACSKILWRGCTAKRLVPSGANLLHHYVSGTRRKTKSVCRKLSCWFGDTSAFYC